MKKDIISKELIKKIIVEIAKYFLKLDIKDKEIKFLDKEFKRVEKREADIVVKVKDEFKEIWGGIVSAGGETINLFNSHLTISVSCIFALNTNSKSPVSSLALNLL